MKASKLVVLTAPASRTARRLTNRIMEREKKEPVWKTLKMLVTDV